MQAFSIENGDDKHKFHAQKMVCIPKPLRLVFAGRSINIYDYDKNYNPTSVDESVVVAVCYRPSNNTIITPAGNKVKVWNALNGDVKKIFSDISTTGEVTSFALDHFKKRCIIGFSDGEVSVFNVINGAKLKTLARHSSEVNFVLEMHDLGQFVSGSITEGIIKFNKDVEVTESEFIRQIDIKDNGEMRESNLSAMAYRPGTGKSEKDIKMLFLATQSGCLAFFEAETCKNYGQCVPFPNEEITGIMPHSDLDYVIISTSGGKIAIIACPPLPYRFSVVWKFINLDPDTKLPNYVNNSIWSNKKRFLFISDEKSYIRCYDLSKPIEEIIQDKKEKVKKDNSSNSKNHLYPPTLSKDDPPCMWTTKAHMEPIRALEFVEGEDMIFTSGMDKRVKIWNSMTGKFIDALQQKYDKFDPLPIAYKKPGVEGIWAPNLFDRIDKEYIFRKRMEELQNQEKAAENPFTKILQQSMQEELMKKQALQRAQSKVINTGDMRSTKILQARSKILDDLVGDKAKEKSKAEMVNDEMTNTVVNQVLTSFAGNMDPKTALEETEKEEFDPYYNWQHLDLSKLEIQNSTLWRVRVDFDTDRKNFERYLKEVRS